MNLKQLALQCYGAWISWRGWCTVDGVRLKLRDRSSAWTLGAVVHEFQKDQYRLADLDFEPGDVVVDVGAHVGTFSLLLAKKYPFLRILAFEPIPENFASLCENVRANGATNVTPVNRAVTGDGRDLEMAVALSVNSGGGSAQQRELDLPGHTRHVVPSTTLDAVLEGLPGGRCKLLKIDCEGSEHEILLASRLLDRVENLRGEFHINGHLRERGYSIEGLVEHCARFIPPSRISYVSCRMAE